MIWSDYIGSYFHYFSSINFNIGTCALCFTYVNIYNILTQGLQTWSYVSMYKILYNVIYLFIYICFIESNSN